MAEKGNHRKTARGSDAARMRAAVRPDPAGNGASGPVQGAAPAAVLGAMQTAARLGRDLVFPRRCPVCDRPVRPFGALICPDCEPMLQRVREPVCRRCGKPLRSPEASFCGDCRRIPHVYDRGCAVFTYHSAAGGIFRFKYAGRREYAECYGRYMAEKLESFSLQLRAAAREGADSRSGLGGDRGPGAYGAPDAAGRGARGFVDAGRNAARYVRGAAAGTGGRAAASQFDMLVPVPVSEERLRKRGYNQALLLAREISGRTGIPVRDDVLVRTADTLPMKNMGPLERQNNLKKAFQCIGNDVKLSSIMLIDDIYTTGATVDACAQALYSRGAARVCFLTLAIGEDGGPDGAQ